MIRLHIPGLFAGDFSKGETRLGDAQIINDEFNYEVIDGYCGKGTTRLIKALKNRNIKRPYLHISHAHYDHYYGIRKIINDPYFAPRGLYLYNPDTLGDVSNDVKSEKAALRTIIAEAKAKKIPIHYLKDGDTIEHGMIKIKVYRDQPTSYHGNSDAYINNGSLCYWFPELSYLTTGDAGLECAIKHDLHPKIIKLGHHGNDCVRSVATWLKNHGCIFCWDNDYSTKLTDFLMTGREDALAVGMTYLSCHGDINVIFASTAAIVYKDGKYWIYKCSYKEKATLKSADLKTVIATMKGEYGSSNERTTALLNKGYWASQIQNKINEIYKIVRG